MNLLTAGGSGGIGTAFVEALARRPAVTRIIATCNRRPPAIEWRRTLPNVMVIALHPGRTDTFLSRPL